LELALGAWNVLATGSGSTHLPDDLDAAAALFADTTCPDVEFIDDDLRELRAAASDLIAAAAELRDACAEYKASLVELREDLESILTELARELAVTVAVAIAASFITFGAGAIAGAGASTRAVLKYGKIVRQAIVLWKSAKGLRTRLEFAKDLKRLRATLGRIKDLGRRTKPAPVGLPPHVPTGWVRSPVRNGKGEMWQKPGASGNSDSMRIMDPQRGTRTGMFATTTNTVSPSTWTVNRGPTLRPIFPSSRTAHFQSRKGGRTWTFLW
jgi:hypothetical protein